MHSRYVSKLHMAVVTRNLGWIKRLLAEGANPNIMIDDDTLLQHAILGGDAEVAILLVEAGADGPQTFAFPPREGKRTVFALIDGKIESMRVDVAPPPMPATCSERNLG